jgi:predicted nucleic acid-binding protein
MMRVFVDASVLFSACYSASGASRELLRLAAQGQVTLIISDVILEEARRNLSAKAPQAVPFLDQVATLIPFETVAPDRQEVLDACAYTELKDAPIVAAAIKAQVNYLVSLDRAHLVDTPKVAEGAGVPVVVPGELLRIVRNSAT